MAETTAAPSNKPVSFGQKIVRAPSGAAKAASIRKKAKGAINRGMISEKAAKKFLGNV